MGIGESKEKLGHPQLDKIRLTGFYLRNLGANLVGVFTVALLNLFTPANILELHQNYILRGGGWWLLLIPLFFPQGKLKDIPGTLKISVERRIRILYLAGTSVPMIILLGTLSFTFEMLGQLRHSQTVEISTRPHDCYGKSRFFLWLCCRVGISHSFLNPWQTAISINPVSGHNGWFHYDPENVYVFEMYEFRLSSEFH